MQLPELINISKDQDRTPTNPPFISYGMHDISDEDIEAVVKVLRDQSLTQGPEIEKFEERLCQSVDSEAATCVSSGTSALHIAVAALRLPENSRGVVPAITFAASSNALEFCGIRSTFCDVELDTGLMKIESLEQILREGKKVGDPIRLVVPVHYSGQPCDMEKILDLKEKYDFHIVEDAAHALGAFYENGMKVGSCFGSDMTMFSFHPVKHVATGEGGAVTTNSEQLNRRLLSLRSHGIAKFAEEIIHKDRAFDSLGQPNPWYMEMLELGYNYRLPDILAALGSSQLKRLPQFVKKRRSLSKHYNEILKSSDMKFSEEDKYGMSSFHLKVVLLQNPTLVQYKGLLMRELREMGIGTQVHYIPVPQHPYYARKGHTIPQNANSFYQSQLSIPLFPKMENKDVERVVDALTTVSERIIREKS